MSLIRIVFALLAAALVPAEPPARPAATGARGVCRGANTAAMGKGAPTRISETRASRTPTGEKMASA